MRVNEKTVVVGESVVLVPYRREHVEVYHRWMQSPFLQAMTASEPLTLEEEYAMQASWHVDDNKCTFIMLAMPPGKDRSSFSAEDIKDAVMIGDVNLFLTDVEDLTLAEVEIMIAEEAYRGQGRGIEATRLMMGYAIHVLNIRTFQSKISFDNPSSIHMFEKLGFRKVSESSIFKEVTLELESKHFCFCGWMKPWLGFLLVGYGLAYKLPSNGTATVTHYALGSNVGACDCKTGANAFPVAAINQNAYGSNVGGSGPGCGRCFAVSLQYAVDSTQPYTITSNPPHTVVKIVDMCPAADPNLEWCAQTDTTPNQHGAWVHFDISQDSIPSSFFPQPFGYDLGTWMATYDEVDCSQWAGYNAQNTSGLDYPGAGCCPKDPLVDGLCAENGVFIASAPSTPSSRAPTPHPDLLLTHYTILNRHGDAISAHLQMPRDAPGRDIIVICHGMLNTRYSKVMRTIAHAVSPPYPVLAFDFQGNGYSTGTTSYGNYEDELDTLEAVVQFARDLGYNVSAIIGHSKGAAVTLLYAGRHKDVPLIVNVAARYDHTVSPATRFTQEHQRLLKEQGWFFWRKYGFDNERKFIVRQADLERRCKVDMSCVQGLGHVESIRILNVHGTGDEVVPVTDVWKFDAALRELGAPDKAHVQTVLIEGAGHSFLQEPSKAALAQALRQFIDAHWEWAMQHVLSRR